MNGPMSEQHPLLCDEVLEEDRLSPSYRRRLFMSRARAKNHVKGAAAIIARWPEHWTVLLNCWWIGIVMLAITTYILYSCVYSYAMLQPTNTIQIPTMPQSTTISNKPSKLISKTSLFPKVFMHIFVDDKQEVNLQNYMPHIEKIANKYRYFQYELIIVANNSNVEMENLGEIENNKLALNTLWTVDMLDKTVIRSSKNVNIKFVNLSDYLYDSPLKKYWKSLPDQLIKFLVRAVSIWERGGIAFDPIVLTPQSPNAIYIDKVSNILKMFKTKKTKIHSKSSKQFISSRKINKFIPKPNNIQDIINALENENATKKSYQEPLAEVETKHDLTVTIKRNIRSVTDMDEDNSALRRLTETQKGESNNSKTHPNDTSNKEEQFESSPNLLPLFLEYLFHNKEMKRPNETMIYSDPKQKVNQYKPSQVIEVSSETIDQNNNDKPIIISTKGIFENPVNETKLTDVKEKKVETLFEVTIDLKGNIVATDTACHAFIGSMFTNAIHHDRTESLTDFIIKELTVFCKGLFASCVGIDVILL